MFSTRKLPGLHVPCYEVGVTPDGWRHSADEGEEENEEDEADERDEVGAADAPDTISHDGKAEPHEDSELAPEAIISVETSKKREVDDIEELRSVSTLLHCDLSLRVSQHGIQASTPDLMLALTPACARSGQKKSECRRKGR